MFSTIGLIIDIAIVLALVIFGIIGFRKGFLHSVISLFSWAACLTVAIFTAKYVAGWINGIYNFSALIGNGIEKSFTGMHEVFAQAINTFESKDALLASAMDASSNGLLDQLIKVVFSNSAVDMASTQTVASFLGASLGQIIMVVISGILVFIVLKIAVHLLTKLFDKIAKTKILGTLNKILGLILGAVKAGLVIVVLNIVLVALSMIPAINTTVTPIITENTKVEKFIYNKTDELFGKYIVEGDMLDNWIEGLWEARK